MRGCTHEAWGATTCERARTSYGPLRSSAPARGWSLLLCIGRSSSSRTYISASTRTGPRCAESTSRSTRQFVFLPPSGSGKSTLLHLIYRRHDVDGGRIHPGRDIARLDARSIRIFGATWESYFRTSSSATGRSRRTFACRSSWGSPEDRHGPRRGALDGGARRARRRAPRPSGGEQQRVAVARAMTEPASFSPTSRLAISIPRLRSTSRLLRGSTRRNDGAVRDPITAHEQRSPGSSLSTTGASTRLRVRQWLATETARGEGRPDGSNNLFARARRIWEDARLYAVAIAGLTVAFFCLGAVLLGDEPGRVVLRGRAVE